MMMTTNPRGLYVHIPFCKRKCNYCDFCSKPAHKEEIDEYITALTDEIKTYRRDEKIRIDTVFIGGGTPSLLTLDQFLKIDEEIKKTFDTSCMKEYTIEVNPATLNRDVLSGYIASGVNRISIGMQTIHENEGKILGRIHSYEDFERTYNMVRSAGINNVNVDIMYGIPSQTEESFSKTLEKIIGLSPEHVSCYGLIVEEGTPFFEMRKNLDLPDEDTEVSMYEKAHDLLVKSGYLHYEISNYAKPGYKCSHNLKYWNCEEYIGVGIAAHSYYEGERFSNSKRFSDYYSRDTIDCKSYEERSESDERFEYAMLALRLSEGIDLKLYRERFGEDFISSDRKEAIDRFINAGLMELALGRLMLTYRGFYLSSAIMAEIL